MSEFLDAVKERRSVRTFDGKGISEALLKDVLEYANNEKNPYGVTVRYELLEKDKEKLSSPVLSGEKYYLCCMVDKKEPHAEEAYGYSFQDVLMYAHMKGLGTVWIGGTMPRDKFEKAAGVKENEMMPCMSPLGIVASKMGVKEVLMRKGVKADWRYSYNELYYKDDLKSPMSEEDAKKLGIFDLLEAVRFAPSAVNKQPWRIIFKDNKLHFYEKKDKGFVGEDTGDLQKIDVGIALYNFEAEAKAEGRKVTFEISDPGISIAEDMEYIASYSL